MIDLSGHVRRRHPADRRPESRLPRTTTLEPGFMETDRSLFETSRMVSTSSRSDGRQTIVFADGPGGGPARLVDGYRAILQGQSLDWNEPHRFDRILGSGGQGVVFLCERQGGDDFRLPVALKVFSPERYSTREAYEQDMARMARVAMKVALIQQDHLLDVLNFVVVGDGIRVMEMEWVDGCDLQRLLTTEMIERVRDRLPRERWEYLNDVIWTPGDVQPRLKPGIAIAVLRDCLAALSALHQNGIVHGDVKPSNIMLKRTGHAKLIDIGAAFDRSDPFPKVVCTPAYAAPEVLGGKHSDPLSDLASLGYVLVEMLSGTRPFAGLSDFDEIKEAKAALAAKLRDYLPSEVVRNELLMNLIRRLIAIDPEQRFPSAYEADLVEQGAASFQRQLVKGNLASEYAVDIQTLLAEVD